MNRRDTIIVAALVNAGLLIVLFVSALKHQEETDGLALKREVSDLMVENKVAVKEMKKVLGDDVDLVLKQYTQKDPLQTEIAARIEPASKPVPSFIEELEQVTKVTKAVEKTPVASQHVSVKQDSPSYVEVTVKKGDMLEKIARKHQTTVSAIIKLNHLASTNLKIGQTLKIPAKGEVEAPKATLVSSTTDSTSSKFYTVKAGDSPWTIAVKNHLKVEELLRLNNMTEEKARKLRPGDQIQIR